MAPVILTISTPNVFLCSIDLDLWIFILYFPLQSNYTLLIFVFKLFQLWPLVTFFIVSCVLLILLCFFFFKLSYFLVLKCARGLSRVFPAPVLESVISPESWFLLWENGVTNQELGDLVERSRKYMCVYWPTYVLLSRNMSVAICMYIKLNMSSYLHIKL